MSMFTSLKAKKICENRVSKQEKNTLLKGKSTDLELVFCEKSENKMIPV